MQNVFPVQQIEEYLEREKLRRNRWAMSEFGKFRYAIDIDGKANAWGLLEKFIMQCCVLKVASPYEQWFYSQLQPWTHYVPVCGDLSDLKQKIGWCLTHEAECEWIAANGGCLAASLTLEAEIGRSCPALMSAADIRQAHPRA